MALSKFVITVACNSSWDVLVSITATLTSGWSVGNGVQADMRQMAAVPWISTDPS